MRHFIFLSSLLLLCWTLGFSHMALAGTEPTIDQTSVQVTTRRVNSYLGTNKEPDDSTWSWTPRVKFRINGPISSGSVAVVEFFNAAKKPWVKFHCPTEAIGADEWYATDGGLTLSEHEGSIMTGPVDFTISLKNELEGSNKLLFKGTAIIKKVHAGSKKPEEKNYFDFYADHDWNLPIGYVFAPEPISQASGGSDYEETAPLNVAMWFRGDPSSTSISAHLFYQGKEICNTKSTTQGTMLGEEYNSTFDDSPFLWTRKCFSFSRVLVFNRENPDNHTDFFRLDKNPGVYEIKVLRNGQLVRTAKFSVKPDGTIANTGFAERYKLGTRRMVIPVTVLGEQDGTWDKDAWKAGSFYGNPISDLNP
ncbi:MAG: hypothetical protein K1Y36_21085 [Blastocatellia bacterium]|nr:hypothetical protein [Blastocatellia bacterium]